MPAITHLDALRQRIAELLGTNDFEAPTIGEHGLGLHLPTKPKALQRALAEKLGQDHWRQDGMLRSFTHPTDDYCLIIHPAPGGSLLNAIILSQHRLYLDKWRGSSQG